MTAVSLMREDSMETGGGARARERVVIAAFARVEDILGNCAEIGDSEQCRALALIAWDAVEREPTTLEGAPAPALRAHVGTALSPALRVEVASGRWVVAIEGEPHWLETVVMPLLLTSSARRVELHDIGPTGG